MEEFEQLSWRLNDVSKLDIGTNFIKEEIIENSYVYLNNFTPYEFPIKESPENKPKQKNKTVYPKSSCLNETQHLQCLKALQLLESGRPLAQYSQQERQLINMYNNLKLSISNENKLFLNYVENEWKTKLYQRTKPKQKKITYFVKKQLEYQLDPIKNYKQFYDQDIMIPLASNENTIDLYPESCLLELGTVAFSKHPVINKSAHLNFNRLFSPNSIKNYIIAEGEELIITKLPVSQDIYAEELAKRYNCDIVISSSGLKTIVDNYAPDYNSSWDLPIIIREYDIDGVKKKISYVDKCLPQRNSDWRYFNRKAYKILLKTNLCTIFQHRFEIPESIKSHFKSYKASQNKGTSDENNDKKIETTIENNELQTNKPAESIETSDNVNNDTTKTKSIPKKSNYNYYHNVSYRIWKLKLKEEKQVLLKGSTESKEIKILVRCKNDGCNVEKNGLLTPLVLVPKLEYQCEHGGELITRSEILRQWTSLLFRPCSNLTRIRINASTGSFVKIENMNINTLANESCKHYKISPVINLSVLFNVLSNINKLTLGNYILHHLPKHGPFAAVMKNLSDKGTLNLSELCSGENCKIEQSLKWYPIDTTLLLPHHVENNLMPGIFPPAAFKSQCENTKNKKKKGKKKNK